MFDIFFYALVSFVLSLNQNGLDGCDDTLSSIYMNFFLCVCVMSIMITIAQAMTMTLLIPLLLLHPAAFLSVHNTTISNGVDFMSSCFALVYTFFPRTISKVAIDIL